MIDFAIYDPLSIMIYMKILKF